MGTRPPVSLTLDQHQLVKLRRALAAESDGKALRKDLIKDLREAALPGVPKLQAAVRQIPDVSPAAAEPTLREAVASQITVAVALGGKNPGVKFRVAGKAKVRGFRFAGRRLNAPDGWRHPVFGEASNGQAARPWVRQVGNSGERWFEPTVLRDKDQYREAVRAALEKVARRIASRTQRGSR